MSDSTIDRSRPWSPVEILMEMQSLHGRIGDEIATLKALGIAKGQATDRKVKAEARNTLVAKFDRPDLSSDALRKAWVIAETATGDLMLEEDVANTTYWDQKTTIDVLQADMTMLQSMLRASQREIDSWPENRPQPHHQPQGSHQRRG